MDSSCGREVVAILAKNGKHAFLNDQFWMNKDLLDNMKPSLKDKLKKEE